MFLRRLQNRLNFRRLCWRALEASSLLPELRAQFLLPANWPAPASMNCILPFRNHPVRIHRFENYLSIGSIRLLRPK